MLFLPKRKIISMMREVFPSMRKTEREELANRLDKAIANKAIEAVWELAILWALSKTWRTNMYLSASHTAVKPDAEVYIGLDKPIAIEIKTVSGDPFEFRNDLEKASNAIFSLSNRIKPGSGDYISIRYFEWRGVSNSVKPRIPSVTDNVENNQEFKNILSNFLFDDTKREMLINIPNIIYARLNKTSVKSVAPHYTCQIPNLPQSVKNNVSTKLINDVKKQLGPFRDTHYLGLVVCDGGNETFSNPNSPSASYGFVSGAAIMNYIIRNSPVDFIVCVGRRDDLDETGVVVSAQNKFKTLAFAMFYNPQMSACVAEAIRSKLRCALDTLPIPLLHPYQSKALQIQEAFGGSARRYYHNGSISWQKGESMKVRISSRALLEILTGEMPVEQSEHLNLLKDIRSQRKHIAAIKLEDFGDDRDDDLVVIELSDDATSKTFAEIERGIPTDLSEPKGHAHLAPSSKNLQSSVPKRPKKTEF